MHVAARLGALALLFSSPAIADDFPLARDSWATTNSASVACAEGGDFDRLSDLIQEHDEDAAAKFSLEHRCRRLLPSTLGKIEDVSVFHVRYCFRPRGESDCVWVRASSVSRASAPDTRPDQCDLTANAIAKATGATWFEKNELSGIRLDQGIYHLNVYCTDANDNYVGIANTVGVGSDGNQPATASEFNLLAAAATVAFGAPFQATASEAQRCFKTAARSDSMTAESKVGGLFLWCLVGVNRTDVGLVLSIHPLRQ
jgi:hypothetical protein